MAKAYTYHYTKSWRIKWSTIETNNFVDEIAEDYEKITATYEPEWLSVNKENLRNKKLTTTIQKGFQLLLSVRFYCKKVVTGEGAANGTFYYLLNRDVLSNVKINWSAYTNKINVNGQNPTGPINFAKEIKSNQKLYGTDGTTEQVISNRTYFENSSEKNTFLSWFNVKSSNFTMDNPGVVTATVNLGTNYANFGGDPTAGNMTNISQLGETVFFKIYDAVGQPSETPPSFVDSTAELLTYLDSSGTSRNIVERVYDRCEKKWYALSLLPAGTNKTSAHQISTAKTDGSNFISGSVIYEKNVTKGKFGKQALLALQLMRTKKIGNCSGTTSSAPVSNTTPVPPPDSRLLPKGNLRWNPPPHNVSRGVPLMEYVNKLDPESVILTEPAFAKLNTAELKRGKIFQDSLGAEILNTNPDKIALPGKGKQQWGFRFMYNPTTFSYSSASNNNVDWTLGASDPTALIVGNSTVQFELYLNRIADMSFLKQSNVNLSTGYPNGLQEVEIKGILNRGTEYDIEFLYRVLNGDPLKKPLLFSKEYGNTLGGVTSDFGYTTAIPCWLYLNENLRYYGSVANFNVNHVMFDLNMVPMLSTVSITFNRYPALFDKTRAVSKADQKAADAFKARGAATKTYLVSTGIEPDETD
jgi:hypothetical protein